MLRVQRESNQGGLTFLVRVGILDPDFDDLVLLRDESIEHSWIEVQASSFLHHGKAFFQCERWLVRTLAAERVEYVGDCEVRAFGSRVDGSAKDYSDLDVAVVAPNKIKRRTKMLLREAFEESDLPFRVDVIDYNGASDEFRAIIDAKYEILQKKQ